MYGLTDELQELRRSRAIWRAAFFVQALGTLALSLWGLC